MTFCGTPELGALSFAPLLLSFFLGESELSFEPLLESCLAKEVAGVLPEHLARGNVDSQTGRFGPSTPEPL